MNGWTSTFLILILITTGQATFCNVTYTYTIFKSFGDFEVISNLNTAIDSSIKNYSIYDFEGIFYPSSAIIQTCLETVSKGSAENNTNYECSNKRANNSNFTFFFNDYYTTGTGKQERCFDGLPDSSFSELRANTYNIMARFQGANEDLLIISTKDRLNDSGCEDYQKAGQYICIKSFFTSGSNALFDVSSDRRILYLFGMEVDRPINGESSGNSKVLGIVKTFSNQIFNNVLVREFDLISENLENISKETEDIQKEVYKQQQNKTGLDQLRTKLEDEIDSPKERLKKEEEKLKVLESYYYNQGVMTQSLNLPSELDQAVRRKFEPSREKIRTELDQQRRKIERIENSIDDTEKLIEDKKSDIRNSEQEQLSNFLTRTGIYAAIVIFLAQEVIRIKNENKESEKKLAASIIALIVVLFLIVLIDMGITQPMLWSGGLIVLVVIIIIAILIAKGVEKITTRSESSRKDILVWIIGENITYHKENCAKLNGKDDAKSKKLGDLNSHKPCKICKPD